MRRGQSSESITRLIKRLQIRALVAKGHKNTNAPLIFENLGYYFFCFGLRSGQFRGQKSLGPLEIVLEMAHYVVCPQKKIISRIFKISGALIVIVLSSGYAIL